MHESVGSESGGRERQEIASLGGGGRSRILIVDDVEDNLLLLEAILEGAGYREVVAVSDPTTVPDLCATYGPDLILLDLHMPQLSGLEVMERLRPLLERDFVPIVVLTADVSRKARLAALEAGAKDFLSKPLEETEVLLRIRNLLETRRLYLALHNQNQMLEEKVAERTQELETAKVEILERLALAAEFRDDQTGEHTERVGRISALVAAALGLPDDQVQLIRQAAPLHDVGKIGIPDRILLKPGRLSPEEFDTMKRHTVIGSRLLSGSISPTLQIAERIALTHHERWDGKGYFGQAGGDIPMAGRVLAVADVFDALIHDRPYKKAWELEPAIEEIARQRGRQFDARVVHAFLEVHGEVDLRHPVEVPSHAA